MIGSEAVQEVAMPETGDAQPQAQKPAAAALQAKLNQGMALHQQGNLADAERCYGEVLQRQPDHFGALHLLGVIARQTRRTERGVELIKRAIGLNPNVAGSQQLRQCADGPEASRGSAGKLRQGDRAQARLRRGTLQSRQCAEGPEASRGSAGELRQGDRAQAGLCRGAQQSRQCAEGPEASRGSAGELRQGDRAQARLSQRRTTIAAMR